MSEKDVHVVVLAAGQGRRMQSGLPKVLHRLAGRSLLEHVLAVAEGVSPASITVIVGHGGDVVRSSLVNRPDATCVTQEPQLGTAHALQQAESVLRGKSGTLVMLSGDVPLLTVSTLHRLLALISLPTPRQPS